MSTTINTINTTSNITSTTFEELLARDGYLVYKIRGVSMEPLLRQNRDLVVIKSLSSCPKGCPEKYDAVLYKRGKNYVLHRIIRVCEDHYLIRGDNTYSLEYVPTQAVIGVLTAFTRKGRQHDVTERGYLFYVHFWHAIYPLRHAIFKGRRLLSKIVRKIRDSRA